MAHFMIERLVLLNRQLANMLRRVPTAEVFFIDAENLIFLFIFRSTDFPIGGIPFLSFLRLL